MKKQDDKNYGLMIVVILFFVVVLLVLVFMPGKTINFSEKKEGNRTRYLSCFGKEIDNYVLLGDKEETDVEFVVKIKYLDDKIGELNLKISKNFENKELAEFFVNELHANYNVYVGGHGVLDKNLVPSYNYVDGEGKMVLFMDDNALDSRTAPLIFLDDGVLRDESIESFFKYYVEIGFSCDIK